MDRDYIEKIALLTTNILDKMARDGRIHTYESIFDEDDSSFHFSIEFKDIAYCGTIDKDGLEYYTLTEKPNLPMGIPLDPDEICDRIDFLPRYDEDYNDLIKEALKKF